MQTCLFVAFVIYMCYHMNQCVDGLSLGSLAERVTRLEMVSADGSMSNNVSLVDPADMKSCPSDFYLHRGTFSCYRVMTDVKSWYEAREDCHSQGADLIWYESMVEYRHVVIKLLTSITSAKDYNNAGYWSGANDITGGALVWGDTDLTVMSSFMKPLTQSTYFYNQRRPSSGTDNSQKHCIFMEYERSTMRMKQELSECDGGRRYICKCKTMGSGSCQAPSKKIKAPEKD